MTQQQPPRSDTQSAFWDRLSDAVLPIGTLGLMVALWQVVSMTGTLPDYVLPSPASVVHLIIRRHDQLAFHTFVTSFEIVGGFLISLAVGVILAFLITSYRTFDRAIFPLLVISQAVPKAALAPLLIVWFGLGWEPKIIVAVLIAFFPIVIDLVTGIRSVPASMHQLALSMGATRSQTILKFLLPHALPHLFSGLKVAVTLAVSGAIIGEFVGADRGLGYLLMFANGQMDTTLLFACIVILALLGVALFYALLLVERICIPWHVSSRHGSGRARATS